jgi:phosphatidylglycerol:prolipoprotein diacylglycerol transferase
MEASGLADIFIRMLSPYGIMAVFGALTALGVFYYNLLEAGYPVRARVKLLAAAFISILVGVCFANMGNWIMRDTLHLPLDERIQEAGLTWYPGLLGGLLAYALMLWALKQDVRAVMNIAAPSYPLLHAFGRVGCAFAGCCYGVAADFNLPGVHFDRVPTQIIEAAFELALFFVVQFAVKKHRLAVYMCAYAAFRFVIEFFRGDAARGAFIEGLPGSPAQQIAVGCVIVTGAVLLALRLRAKERVKQKDFWLGRITL